MITSQQAEELAHKHMYRYVAACGCETHQDVANALMKMASMCGLGMVAYVAASVGGQEASSRMFGTADYIAKVHAGEKWKKAVMQ